MAAISDSLVQVDEYRENATMSTGAGHNRFHARSNCVSRFE